MKRNVQWLSGEEVQKIQFFTKPWLKRCAETNEAKNKISENGRSLSWMRPFRRFADADADAGADAFSERSARR